MVIKGDALRGAHPNEPATKSSRVLVTGGHGFLGSVVVRQLEAAGYSVSAPTSKQYDLRDLNEMLGMVSLTDPQCIIHCAARCGGIGANIGNEAYFMRDNLLMGMNVLEAGYLVCRSRVIIIGSVCAYPENCPQPMKEDDLWSGWPEPTNGYYGIAKRTVMAAADAYRKQYGMSTLNLVLTNLYGPGDNFDPETSHFVPAIIRKISEATRNGSISLWGDGTPTRDLLYVEDAAEAIVWAVRRPEVTGTINVASGNSFSIAEITSFIATLMKWTGAAIHWDESKPNGQQSRRLDTSRAADLLGWRSSTPLAAGLGRTIRSFLAQQPEAQVEVSTPGLNT